MTEQEQPHEQTHTQKYQGKKGWTTKNSTKPLASQPTKQATGSSTDRAVQIHPVESDCAQTTTRRHYGGNTNQATTTTATHNKTHTTTRTQTRVVLPLSPLSLCSLARIAHHNGQQTPSQHRPRYDKSLSLILTHVDTHTYSNTLTHTKIYPVSKSIQPTTQTTP